MYSVLAGTYPFSGLISGTKQLKILDGTHKMRTKCSGKLDIKGFQRCTTW